MKRLSCCVLLMVVAVMAGCGNNNSQIRTVAQGYLDAMGNYRPSDARQFATKETCDITLAFFEKMMQYTAPSVYADNIPATITLGDVAIVEDTVATVSFHKHTPTVEQDGSVNLVKRNGHWLVHEVIKIPDNLNFPSSPRTFTDEEVEEMRRNKKSAE